MNIYKRREVISKMPSDNQKNKYKTMIDLGAYFGSLAAVAGVVMTLSGWAKTYVIKVDGFKAQLLTWLISIGIAFLGQWQNIGIFENANLLTTVLNGVGVGLVANGLYSIESVKNILALLKAKQTKA